MDFVTFLGYFLTCAIYDVELTWGEFLYEGNFWLSSTFAASGKCMMKPSFEHTV